MRIMKILICEEDRDCIDSIVMRINKCKCNEEIVFESYVSVLGVDAKIDNTPYDLAFIGEKVNHYNGLELCQYLRKVQPNCELIVLAHDYECLKDVFDLKARQLIIYGKEELIGKEFQKFLEEYQYFHYEVTFHGYDGDVYLSPSEILYIRTYKDTTVTEIMTNQGIIQGEFDDLIQIKEKLKDYMFFQVHSYYFVNADHVLLVKKGKVGLDNGDFIPSSVLNHQITRRIYQICMRDL